ncbi:MAG TPA: methyltransferase domain-containing protein [Steroidobacteraceae bacterium]|nr:methyltransferase domain-containing protein [Steroidobacteraceae bacterium]
MRTVSLSRLVFIVVAGCALAAVATSPAHADRYSDAVAHEGRPAGDLKRDLTDHPAEVLRLAGIRPGTTVVDFLAGDGYYSELASYIVGPRGHVYMLNNVAYDKWSNDDWQGRVDGRRLPNVEHRTIVVEHLGLPAHSVDAMLLIKVYHDLFWKPVNGPWPKDIDPDAVLTEIARVMKPGGVLLLVDHSAKPGTGNQDADTLHRIDEQYARRDFEKHGFQFVRQSDVLRHADDPRDMITYKGEMFGKTDRFVMVFRNRTHPGNNRGR